MVLNVENDMISIKTANIGDRIESGGYFGTVKYIGLIEGYNDVWLGIDWDDSRRGRHNGTVNGINYFTASTDSSASFVRPEKVHLGQSVVSAITSRYGQRDDETTAKLNEQEHRSFQKSINAPFLQFVGFEKIADKQSDFEKLEIINVRLQNVSTLEGPLGLRQLCPNVIELDVSKNLFTDWTVVFNICLQLQHLQWLNVSENLMILPSDCDNYQFPNLRVLICGTMKLHWDNLLELAEVYPNLEELRAPLNNITTINMHNGQYAQLKLLDLEGNPIESWDEICKLAILTSLEHINLENTGISQIRFNESSIFRNLRKLVISRNFIEDWESIGELNKLPNLEDLRFLKNPVLDTQNYETCIQLIVARIANLQMFNGAIIQPDERKGAEYDYIKKYGLEWLSILNDAQKKAEFVQKHNRYEELTQQHGTPEESELVVQSKLIKVSLLDVLFVHNEHTVKKKLPPTILIQKIIMLAQRLFSLSSRPTLTYVSGLKSEIEIPLSDEGKELGFYSVQDGDKIIVNY